MLLIIQYQICQRIPMEKMFYEKLYNVTIASLCFGVSIISIRILPFEWLNYSPIYDILSMCCGFVSATILLSYRIFKALCIISLCFIVYFLFFKVPLIAIMTALCAFILQIASLYVQNKIKVFLLTLYLGIIAFMAYYNDFARLEFILEFAFWWHTAWLVLLFVFFEILKNIKNGQQRFL